MFTADQQTALNGLIQAIFPMTIRGVTFSYNDPANLNASVQVAYGRDLFPAERPTVIFKYTVGQSQIRFLDGWLPDIHVDTVVAVNGEPTRYIPLNNSYIDIPVVLTDVPSSALQLYIKQNTTHKSNLKVQLLNSDMITVEEHKLWYYEIEEDDWTVVLPGNLNIIPDEYTLRVTEEWFSTDIFDTTANSLSIGQGNGYYPYKYTKSDVYDNAGEINFIKLQITCIARTYKLTAASTQIRGHIIADRIAKRIKHEINKGNWLTTLSATGLTLYNVTGVTYSDTIPLEGAEPVFRTVIEASGAIPLGLDAEDLSGEEAAILANGVNVEDIRLENERVGAIQDAVPRKVSDDSGTYVGVPSIDIENTLLYYYEDFSSPFSFTPLKGIWEFTPGIVGVTGNKLAMNLDNNSAGAEFKCSTRLATNFSIETYVSVPDTSGIIFAGINAYDSSGTSSEINFAVDNTGGSLVLYFYASIDYGINYIEREMPLPASSSFSGTLKLKYEDNYFYLYLDGILINSYYYVLPITPDVTGLIGISQSSQTFIFDEFKLDNLNFAELPIESVSPIPRIVSDDTGATIGTTDLTNTDTAYSELASVDESATPIKVAYDEGTYVSTSELIVYDSDVSAPVLTLTPSNISFSVGETGNVLSWIATDENPDTYTVTSDIIGLVQSGSWSSGVQIDVNVDSFIGQHTVTMIFYDVAGRSTEDTVLVTVGGDGVINGGFETVFDGEWTGTGSRQGSSYAHSGSYGAAISTYDLGYKSGYLEQLINSAPTNNVTLTLWQKNGFDGTFRVTVTYLDESTTIANYGGTGFAWVLRTISLDADKLIVKLRIEWIGTSANLCACDDVNMTIS